MPESIESLRKPRIEVVNLPINSISPDPKNPNRIPEDLLEALGRDIVARGFVQPVLVRSGNQRPPGHPEAEWVIVDGEHRWTKLKEFGAEECPCVIDPLENEEDAQVRMLTMNRLRGEFVPVKLARLLVDLSESMGEDELRTRLSMDEGEFRDTLEFAGFDDDVSQKLGARIEAERKAAPEVLQFVMSKADAAKVEKVIEPLVNDDTDRGKALVAVCEDYASRPVRAVPDPD